MVHVEVEVERELRRALAEPGAWNQLRELSSRLAQRAADVSDRVQAISGEDERRLAGDLGSDLRNAARQLSAVAECCDSGRPDDIVATCESAQARLLQPRDLHRLSVRLRTLRNPASLTVAAADADLDDARLLIGRARQLAATPLFAVIGDAGKGKTFLGAQLTAHSNQRPAGVFILGVDLAANGSLDHLARRVAGLTVQTFDELLEAVEAAGARAGRRLPIVIDGLNEAQDPRAWRTLLSRLSPVLNRYPHALLVVTLRSSVAEDALIGDAAKLTLHGFEHNLREAVDRYFQHYLIDPGDAWLPWGGFRDPLFLRMFCEATNPERTRRVGVEALPTSLTAVFERYRDTAVERIRQRLRLPPNYIPEALDKIANALWGQNSRALPSDELGKLVGDDPREWDRSLMRALEEEGVLWRAPGPDRSDQRSAVLFDAFAGFLIADALVRSASQPSVGRFATPDIWEKLGSGPDREHPLATDILRAMVAVLPRRQGCQLWKMAPPAVRDWTVAQTADLEAQYLDSDTVHALGELIARPPSSRGFSSRNLLDRLMEVRDGTAHPLNAEFADRILRGSSACERDVRWTEWVRARTKEHQADLDAAERRWMADGQRNERDHLSALWIAWLLTSTVRLLRDRATRALSWYGRGTPAALFELTLRMLGVNDPYVPERMLAASYGVAMALHADPTQARFRDEVLPNYARKIFCGMFAARAPHSTTHALMRDFARQTIEIARLHQPGLLDARECKRITPPFKGGDIRKWGRRDESEHSRSPFHMDFENYTIGRLVPNRHNYDYKDPEYQEVRGKILWRVFNLGWAPEVFGEIDVDIGRSSGRHEQNRTRVDRYGKKYSWIAYHEMYGHRYDRGLLKGEWIERGDRPSDIDIDPSFPDIPRAVAVVQRDFLGDRSLPFAKWLEGGGIPDVSEYLVTQNVDGQPGPWVLLNGYVNQEDDTAERGRFMFLRAFLVPSRYRTQFGRLLETQNLGGRWLPEIPELHYTLAGEIPWCDTFPANGFTGFEFDTGSRTRHITRPRLVFERNGTEVGNDEIRAVLSEPATAEAARQNPDAMLDALARNGISVRSVKERVAQTERLVKKCKALIPVVQSGWESYHSGLNPASHAVVPCRELAESLRLWLRLPSWDMADSNGRLASVTTQWGEEWRTAHHFTYLRQDLLNHYLQTQGFALTWAVWGEREFHTSPEELWRRADTGEQTFRVFQQVYRYEDQAAMPGQTREIDGRGK